MKAYETLTKLGLASFTMIMVIGNGLFIPIMPAIQEELTLTAKQSSLLLSIFTYVGALMILLGGWLSERYGRRKILIMSLLCLIAGCVIAALAGFTSEPNVAYKMILIGRILQGIGAGATAPIGMILAAERYPNEQQPKVFSFLEIVNGLSKTAGPILGGIIVAYHWQAGFIWYLAIAMIALVATIAMIGPKKKAVPSYSNVRIWSYWRQMLPIIANGFFVMFFLYGLLFLISSGIQQSVGRSLFIALPLAILVVMSYFYGGASFQSFKKLQRMIKWGVVGLLVTAILFSFVQIHMIFLIIAACIVGFISGVVLPASTSALVLLVPSTIREKAISWLSMIRFIGVASGPILFSAWMENWTTNRFIFLSIAGAIGLIVCIFWKEKDVFKYEMHDN